MRIGGMSGNAEPHGEDTHCITNFLTHCSWDSVKLSLSFGKEVSLHIRHTVNFSKKLADD